MRGVDFQSFLFMFEATTCTASPTQPTTEYRQRRWAMFSDQQCWPSWCTARLQRGRVSAQQPTVRDSMRSCVGVSDSGTAAERR